MKVMKNVTSFILGEYAFLVEKLINQQYVDKSDVALEDNAHIFLCAYVI